MRLQGYLYLQSLTSLKASQVHYDMLESNVCSFVRLVNSCVDNVIKHFKTMFLNAFSICTALKRSFFTLTAMGHF